MMGVAVQHLEGRRFPIPTPGPVRKPRTGISRLQTKSEPVELNIIHQPQVQSSAVSLRDVWLRGSLPKQESLTSADLNLSAAMGAKGDEPNGRNKNRTGFIIVP